MPDLSGEYLGSSKRVHFVFSLLDRDTQAICRICAFGYYMNEGVCSKCELLHWRYCDALA